MNAERGWHLSPVVLMTPSGCWNRELSDLTVEESWRNGGRPRDQDGAGSRCGRAEGPA